MAGEPNPLLKLDKTPTFQEERRDFSDEQAYSGEKPFDEHRAKGRIDRIARSLAIFWSAFLVYIIMAQGLGDGWRLRISLPECSWFFCEGIDIMLIPKFHLESGDFIAVVTTTTAAVFGFLVIVTNHLFFKRDKNGA
ncbi:hypothetical protein [Mesorhizobium sp. 10J20-29]